MTLFIVGILLLIAGYFTYGKFVEFILDPDDRATPAVTSGDGVDFVVLPHWKNMLIQLLNIAGIGPVIGVILGIKFGAIVFLIMPVGNVLGGAVHDFLSGMMSIRDNGANLPKLVHDNLGKTYSKIFSCFLIVILLLVVAVFINVPAQLCDKLLPQFSLFWLFVGLIFLYYVIATMFPVDKIIGRFYPFFGAMLLIGTVAIFVALLIEGFKNPALLQESTGFREFKFTQENEPILPLLFVTIACGIISGFHATQSPIVARTMKSERQARSTFYGMMIVEGIIGMIWAGAGLAIYNLYTDLMQKSPTDVLMKITDHFLGSWVGTITVLAVVVLAITSGDTAMRSCRLSLAEMMHIRQDKFLNRFMLCLPMIGIVVLLLFWSNADAKSFNFLWNYFAWGNQVIAATALMTGAVWLGRQKKFYLIALLPGTFMTFIIVSYILWTSPAHKQAYGLGMDISIAKGIGVFVSIIFAAFVYYRIHSHEQNKPEDLLK